MATFSQVECRGPGNRDCGWRRGRDSNPRSSCPLTPLAGARLQPLGHLSNPDKRNQGRRSPTRNPALRKDVPSASPGIPLRQDPSNPGFPAATPFLGRSPGVRPRSERGRSALLRLGDRVSGAAVCAPPDYISRNQLPALARHPSLPPLDPDNIAARERPQGQVQPPPAIITHLSSKNYLPE